jgi:ribosomal protein S17
MVHNLQCCSKTTVFHHCRPLSKTVRFNVLRVIPAGAAKKGFVSF